VDAFHRWKTLAVGTCIFTIIGGVIATTISCAICHVSLRGTPTDTNARRLLAPLCKCNMVPLLLLKIITLVLVAVMTVGTVSYCNCVKNSQGPDRLSGLQTCPAHSKWFNMVRAFLALLCCDVVIPSILFCCMMKSKTSRLFRNIRQRRATVAEDDYMWWQRCCQACCEFSSLMTCYMFGGQRLTASRYVDVAIALTAFFEDRGELDIVPSDVAAALVCLMTIQRQKQIDCRNELMKEGGGIYAKDKKFLGKLWSAIKPNSRHEQIKTSLEDESLKAKHNMDIETGVSKQDESFSEAAVSEINLQHVDGKKDKQQLLSDFEQQDVNVSEINYLLQTHSSSSSNQLTEKELAEVRALFNASSQEVMSHVTFSKILHQDGVMTFRPTVRRKLSPESTFDRLVLSEGARYSTVALAAYSWMMYLWTSRCIGCCDLSTTTLCELCFCRPRYCRSRDHVIGDNFCGWKQASVLKTLGIDERDFLFANFRNDVNVCPYIVLIDRRCRNILIVIRGTLSFEDMISDVTISPESLEDVGEEFGFDGTDEFCHRGMLEAAKYVYDDMEARGVLYVALHEHPEFNLRLIGHSLGAGVAAVLGLMMRKKYPLLK
jgi:pentatricopeptide repeat protein